MVEVTPAKKLATAKALSRDVAKVRKRMQRRKKIEDSKPGRVRIKPKWPIKSEAMGVDPEDISTAKAIAASHGVKTDYTPDGRPILTGPAHRRNHARAMGFYDRNAGYGDPAPINR